MEIVEALERRWRELDFTGRFDLAEFPPTESSFVRRLWPHLPALLTSRGFMARQRPAGEGFILRRNGDHVFIAGWRIRHIGAAKGRSGCARVGTRR